MGLEGGVQLGFKQELDAEPNAEAKAQLFNKLLAQAYKRGQASEVASVLEIDAVIDPINTRDTILKMLTSEK
jgi:acetyl-CoA carboxylase carboxyltransferase component